MQTLWSTESQEKVKLLPSDIILEAKMHHAPDPTGGPKPPSCI